MIYHCTPYEYFEADDCLKFPVTPPTDVKKTWEITVTTEDIKIKCNSLQVLHFIFNNTYNANCIDKVKEKKAATVKIWNTDTATKMFATKIVGK